jgi:hypothetical protein
MMETPRRLAPGPHRRFRSERMLPLDPMHFDALARSFGTPWSRRKLGRLVGGLILGGSLAAPGATEVLAAKRIGGAACTKGRQCQTGKCIGPKGQKECSCSAKHAECTSPVETCGGAGTPNVCAVPVNNCGAGGPCPAGADCRNGACECRHFDCPTGDNTRCTLGEVCNPEGSSIRCCCSPNGNTQFECTPGLNAICCSGYCNDNKVCAPLPA